MLVAVEGVEGVGKTTLLKNLKRIFLRNKTLSFQTIKEPTEAIKRSIEQLNLEHKNHKIEELEFSLSQGTSPDFFNIKKTLADQSRDMRIIFLINFLRTKTYYYYAQFMERNPKGLFLVDRFLLSTITYQGILGSIDPKIINDIHTQYLHALIPDLTILLTPTEGRRVKARTCSQELQTLAFSKAMEFYPKKCIEISEDSEAKTLHAVASILKKHRSMILYT